MKGFASLRHPFSTFPERTETYLEEASDGMTIIIEFPGHTIEQIQLHRVGTILIIESAIIACPYRDEITIPEWALTKEPAELKLLNGLLAIKFEK